MKNVVRPILATLLVMSCLLTVGKWPVSAQAPARPQPGSAAQQATGSLVGIIFDAATGRRVAGATVASCQGQTMQTDALGFYWFDDLPVGTCTVTASRDGYHPGSRDGWVAAGAVRWNSIYLRPVTAPPTPPAGVGAIVGIIFDAATGQRVAGATVVSCEGQEIQTGARGLYRFDDLPVGTCTITASRDGYHAGSRDGEVVADAVRWNSIYLRPVTAPPTPPAGVGTITGLIFDAATGQRVAGATVVSCEGQEIQTDARGLYRFDDLPVGTCTVAAYKTGYQTDSRDGWVVGGAVRWNSISLVPVPLTSDRCPLTGQPLADPGRVQRRPLAVRISNSPAARPPSGLSYADLVFEAMAEGGITRFTAIYLCQDSESLGSIRSARLVDLELTPMFDAILADAGASEPILEMIRQQIPTHLDGVHGDPGFHRVPDKPSPHNLYTSTDALWQVAQTRGWQQAVDLRGLTFSDVLPSGGVTATHVAIPYRSGVSDVVYQYDATLERYLRFVAGQPHVEALTGQQLAADDVIVLYTRHTLTDIVEDTLGNRSLLIELVGQGPATVIRQGRAYEGRWVRTVERQVLRFVDAMGNPLPLKRGTTWVQIVPLDFAVEVESRAQ